jgi:putative tryptophan/tyrosine transport system substrate-binding protein
MKRREFITLLGAAAWPLAARAQQPDHMRRIGFLSLGPPSAQASRVAALQAGLRDLGYIEGKNIIIEFRWAESEDQLRDLAADLVRMNVDVIFAPSSTTVEFARQATKTIPIVFSNHADPVGIGHVASLAHPGGNITGLSMLLTELATAGDVHGSRPAREADRCTVESHDAFSPSRRGGRHGGRGKARGGTPPDAGAERRRFRPGLRG